MPNLNISPFKPLNLLGAPAAMNDNQYITPTQVSCTSIPWKPIGLLFLRREFSVVCGELHRCWTF